MEGALGTAQGAYWVPHFEGQSPALRAPQVSHSHHQDRALTPAPGWEAPQVKRTQPRETAHGRGKLGQGFSSDGNSLHLIPKPGAKADTTRTSQKQDSHTMPQGEQPLSPDHRGQRWWHSHAAEPGSLLLPQLGKLPVP